MNDFKEKFIEVCRIFFDFKLCDNDEEGWMSIENDIDTFVSVRYKYNVIPYRYYYYKTDKNKYTDVSIVIYNGGHPIAIWPLNIHLSSCGGGGFRK